MDGNDKMSKPHYIVFMLPIYFLLSIPVRVFKTKYNLAFPQTFFLYILAVGIGVLFAMVPVFGEDYTGLTRVPPEHILAVFLPIYIVSTIYHMDYYIFIRCLPQVIIITSFGLLLSVFCLGAAYILILHPGWAPVDGIVASFAILPIQATQVIFLFKELAKYKYLGTILEAETILVVVSVMVGFEICLGATGGIIVHWYSYIIIVIRFIFGGILVGCVIGKIHASLICYLYNAPCAALTVSIGITFFTYYASEFVMDVSGSLAVICVICFLVVEKHRLSVELDLCFSCFWNTLYTFVEVGTLMTCIVEGTKFVMQLISTRAIYTTFILYFLVNMIRFLSLFILGPILNKMTYELNVRCLMVLGWGGVKGSINYLLAYALLTNRTTNIIGQSVLVEVYLFIFLSLFINSTTMRLMLKLIGLSELSTTRRTNMNNCMRFIMDRRNCVINILKLNRYLADANWGLVRAETIMKHPYKLKLSEENDADDEEDFMLAVNSAICPECFREVPFEVSEKEYIDMLKEAQIKILKAKKVSIIKQFENGIISKNCLQVLVHNLEIMIESNQKTNKIDLRQYLNTNKFLSGIRVVMMLLPGDKILTSPKKPFKKMCFYIMNHYSYDYILFGIIVTYDVLIILNLFIDALTYIYYIHVLFWTLFLTDFLIKILGYSKETLKVGFKVFFTLYWNHFDFSLLSIEIILIFLVAPWNPILGQDIRLYLEYSLQVIGLLRFAKILVLLRTAYPKIIRSIDYKIDCKISFGFDLAAALAFCCDEVVESIGQILELRGIRERFLKDLQDEKYAIVKEMQRVQKERPWIAITVKTKQAIRTTLTAMEESLNELKALGFVDNVEYNYIYKEIFEKQKFLRNMKFVQPSQPKVIFNEVPWMAGNETIIEFLYNHVETVSWDVGEVICKSGRVTKGIYIVVTGLLRLKFVGNEEILEKLKRFGSVPIVDYLSTLMFECSLEDNIMSGNSFGELSVLTGRPYDCTIIADSPGQAYLLTTDVIKEAMTIDSNPVYGLEARMWKYSTINLAVAIMMDIPLYQSYTQEQIKFKLEKAFMPNLRCYKMFVITELMDDIILIEGVASDYNSGDIMVAPMMIPRTTQKLILPKSSYLTFENEVETRLLIIPMGDFKDYEIMEKEEEVAELISITTSKCLLHTLRERRKRKASAKRKIDIGTILTRESITETVRSRSRIKIEVLDPDFFPSEKSSAAKSSLLLLKPAKTRWTVSETERDSEQVDSEEIKKSKSSELIYKTYK